MSILIQNGINSPSATILLKCSVQDEFTTLMAWLTAKGVRFSQSIDAVSGLGTWCVASDAQNSYFTLTEALDSGTGGWYFNDTAWLFFRQEPVA